jgi:hypothetical protein
MLVNTRITQSQLNKTIKTQGRLDESEYPIVEDDRDLIHEDLLYSYTDQKFEKNKFFEEFLNEDSDIKKQLNLCLEYESLDLKSMADNRYRDLLVDLMAPKSENSKFDLSKYSQIRTGRSNRGYASTDRSYRNQTKENNQCQDEDEIWYQYSLFKMRDLDYLTAEEALWKALTSSGAQMPKFTTDRDPFAHPLKLETTAEATE